MVQIAPFRPLQYSPQQTSFISRLVAPPFDVVDRREAERLREMDPHNVIRLTLGKAPPEGREAEEYDAAARTLQAWRRDGVLVPAPEASIYVCEQQFTMDGVRYVRRGMICALLLQELGTGGVLPHEQTMAGPKADRYRLMEACRANLSQVFVMCSDAQGLADEWVARAARGALVCEFRTPEDVAYKMWAVSDPAETGRIAALLRDEVLVIADGHHRYETALRYRDAHRPEGAPPGAAVQDFIPIFCVSVRNAGLKILPTHRVAKAPSGLEPDALLAALGGRFAMRQVTVGGPERLKEALRDRPAADAIGCFLGGKELHWLCGAKPGALDDCIPDRLPQWRRLPVTQLHYAVLGPLLGIPSEAGRAHPRLELRQDVETAYWDVASGRFDVAFLLPPTSPATVEAVARGGERMPPKSTFFYPKMLAGLAIYPFDGDRPVLPTSGA
ncbi:MAG: hypothetical protein AMK73_06485 [Planctomycetes bacterium SM23_32]|nr:MAG: hypothetical protein AMK73_06485 [Planctomycetes bacterium SM23_32]